MAQLTHAILLSDDLGFHETLEPVLRKLSPKGHVSRTHPEGGAGALRHLLGDHSLKGVFLFLDPSQVDPTGPQYKSINKWVQGGGRAVFVGEIPSQLKELQSCMDTGFDSFAHNLAARPKEFSEALEAVLDHESFVSAEADAGALYSGTALISRSQQKSEFLEGMLDALSDAGLQRTRRGRAATVADELIMNALYDAPVLSRRSRLFKSIGNRRSEVQLDPGAKVQVSWSLHRGAFSMTVKDPYGSLEPGVLYKRLAVFHSKKMFEISRAVSSGGGVGLYVVLRNVSVYRARVVPDKTTEISICIDFEETSAQKKYKDILISFSAPGQGGHS